MGKIGDEEDPPANVPPHHPLGGTKGTKRTMDQDTAVSAPDRKRRGGASRLRDPISVEANFQQEHSPGIGAHNTPDVFDSGTELPEATDQHNVRHPTTAVLVSLTRAFSTPMRTDMGITIPWSGQIFETRSLAICNAAMGVPPQTYARLLVVMDGAYR